MRVSILTLCEYATDHRGRLTIVDTFDRLEAHKMPWRAYFYVAAQFQIEKDDAVYRHITMKIISADEKPETVFENIDIIDIKSDTLSLNIVTGFNGLIFKRTGDYLFQIYFDDVLLGNAAFKVVIEGEGDADARN